MKQPNKVKFNIQLKTTKLSLFNPNKDRIPLLSKSCCVYRYTCPGCNAEYIGKTETTLFKRTQQHAWEQKDSSIFKHFNDCHGYQHILDMFTLDNYKLNTKEFQINIVRQNIDTLHISDNWLNLAFLESLAIKDHNPILNVGIKAAKELQLF